MDNENSEKEIKERILLGNWRERAIRASLAHYRQSERYGRRNAVLLVFNVVSAIFILFLTNNELFKAVPNGASGEHQSEAVIDLFLISLTQSQALSMAGFVVVATTVLHAIARFSDMQKLHKVAGNEFTEIKRLIEVALIGEEDLSRTIHEVLNYHTLVARHYPLVSQGVWQEIAARVQSDIEEDESLVKSVGLGDDEPSN